MYKMEGQRDRDRETERERDGKRGKSARVRRGLCHGLTVHEVTHKIFQISSLCMLHTRGE